MKKETIEMKSTQGVMTNINLDVGHFIESNGSGLHIEEYKSIFLSMSKMIEQLSDIEELILQDRCLSDDVLNKIKLSKLREYVYARCPFFRKDKSTKDIRVIVSRTDIIDPENLNPSLEELYLNEKFMIKALNKLILSMRVEHLQCTIQYNRKYE